MAHASRRVTRAVPWCWLPRSRARLFPCSGSAPSPTAPPSAPCRRRRPGSSSRSAPSQPRSGSRASATTKRSTRSTHSTTRSRRPRPKIATDQHHVAIDKLHLRKVASELLHERRRRGRAEPALQRQPEDLRGHPGVRRGRGREPQRGGGAAPQRAGATERRRGEPHQPEGPDPVAGQRGGGGQGGGHPATGGVERQPRSGEGPDRDPGGPATGGRRGRPGGRTRAILTAGATFPPPPPAGGGGSRWRRPRASSAFPTSGAGRPRRGPPVIPRAASTARAWSCTPGARSA